MMIIYIDDERKMISKFIVISRYSPEAEIVRFLYLYPQKVTGMTARTIRQAMRSHRPFGLVGVDSTLPAGQYEIETGEEEIDRLLFSAWQRTATTLRLTEAVKGYGFSPHMEPEP